MAAYFGGNGASRTYLRDEEIYNTLGEGNDSEIEEIDDEGIENPILDSTFLNLLLSEHNTHVQQETNNDFCAPATPVTSFEREVIASQAISRSTSTRNRSRSRNISSRRVCNVVPNEQPSTSREHTSSTERPPTLSSGTRTRRHAYTVPQPWKKEPFQEKNHDYPEMPVRHVRNPIQYFNEYIDEPFFEHMAVCTNLYVMRKTGKELKTTQAETMKFMGMHALMGILSYPRLPMYWRTGIALNKISTLMTRDRFLTLRNALHVVESDTASPGNDNPLWKVQPMIDKIKDGCRKQERGPGFYSIDEQMIPFTGRCALRQVVKNKPRPTGLKNFVLASSQGLMLDFEIYRGAKTMFGDEQGSLGLGPSIILHLAKSVPPGSFLYHDRYFTTIPLIEEMHNRGLHSTGTIMLNRIPDRSTLKLKDDMKMLRGDSDYMVRGNSVLIKWKDNKSVLLASNYTGCENNMLVKRWDKKHNCYVDVTAPNIVSMYHKHMGGVDVLDQQMEYYRTFWKTKKWTLKVLIHFFDLAIVNAWRAYKIDCEANKFPRNKTMDLLDFRLEIHEVLVKAPEKGRLQDEEEDPVVMPRKYQKAVKPSVSVRFDGYDHLPNFDDIKSPRACQMENCVSRTKTRCIKCNVYLCIARNQNCFQEYHQK